MQTSSPQVFLPAVILAVGIGWLLNNLDLFPHVNWVWSLGLAVAGVVVLMQGVNQGTIVLGPLLIIIALLSTLRQLEYIGWQIELPCIVISIGVLLLIARLSGLPDAGHVRRSGD